MAEVRSTAHIGGKVNSMILLTNSALDWLADPANRGHEALMFYGFAVVFVVAAWRTR